MPFHRSLVALLLLGSAVAPLAACSKSKNGGFNGVFTSVDSDAIAFEFRSDGTVVARMGGEQGRPGTFTLDGEKVLVEFGGQRTTFIRDGDCIEDAQRLLGKLCKGGRAAAATNVSTRDLSSMREGTWVASNPDGVFKIEFKGGDKFSFSLAPAASSGLGDKPQTTEGTYVVEGDTLFTTLADSTPMVLKFVNDSYESTAFGVPMKFVRQ